MKAEDIITTLGMQPHPEGGWYVETFVDEDGPDGRARSTAIYFLLKAGEVSHWHRVDAVETWHWHAGAPLALSIADQNSGQTHMVGPDLANGQRPQVVVPRHGWQSARSLGEWTLVGCTVAPGFRFEGFELAPADWQPKGFTTQA
jgi:predicted cupin superfamily sugar epimerase